MRRAPQLGQEPLRLRHTVLDRFWIRDDSYIEAYGIEPNQAWFMKREERDGLMLSEISLDYHSNEPSVNISFNRHRTRWLITDNQLGEIPIGMRERDIETGVKLGLVCRRFEKTDRINVIL